MKNKIYKVSAIIIAVFLTIVNTNISMLVTRAAEDDTENFLAEPGYSDDSECFWSETSLMFAEWSDIMEYHYNNGLFENTDLSSYFGYDTREEFETVYNVYYYAYIIDYGDTSEPSLYFKAFVYPKATRLAMVLTEDRYYVYISDVQRGSVYYFDDKYIGLTSSGYSRREFNIDQRSNYNSADAVYSSDGTCFRCVDIGRPSTTDFPRQAEWTNLPIFENETDACDYISGADIEPTNKEKKSNTYIPGDCDSFGWDSFNLVNQGDKYVFNYTYSNEDMVNNPDVYAVYIDIYSVIKTKSNSFGQYNSHSDTVLDGFNLSDYPSTYSSSSLEISSSGNVIFAGCVFAVADFITNLLGNGTDFSTLEITSAITYVTVTLKHGNWNNGFLVVDQTSSDVRCFSIDNLTGDTTDYSDDVEVSSTDGYVDGISLNDDEQQITIINYTVNDYSNTYTNNVTNTTYDNSTGESIEDDNDDDGGIGTNVSLLSLLKEIFGDVGADTAGEQTSGAFQLMSSYFTFIPASVWAIVIAFIVVIGVVCVVKIIIK